MRGTLEPFKANHLRPARDIGGSGVGESGGGSGGDSGGGSGDSGGGGGSGDDGGDGDGGGGVGDRMQWFLGGCFASSGCG